MKKNSDLKPQDKQELAWTKKRVNYHNRQAKGPVEWMEEVQNVLKQKMGDAKLDQIFEPLHLKESLAIEILFKNARLNKIHSMYCDLYEELPYRPDMAFDVAWRSFEVMAKYYSGEVFGDKDISDVLMFQRISNEVIVNILKKDNHLEAALKSLIEAIPESTLRFVVVRLYLKRELGIHPQLGQIKKRAIDIMGEDLYKDFYNTYFDEEDNLPIANHRSAVRTLRLFVLGEDVDLSGKKYRALSLENRIEFIISCILYVSRCERYHGDYMSQFKSSLAKQATYHNFYFLLTMTDLLFWIVWYKFADHQKIAQIFSLEGLAVCAEQRRQNLETIFA